MQIGSIAWIVNGQSTVRTYIFLNSFLWLFYSVAKNFLLVFDRIRSICEGKQEEHLR